MGRSIRPTHARLESEAGIDARPSHVRFTPKSGHWLSRLECLLYAIADIRLARITRSVHKSSSSATFGRRFAASHIC
jgi:hypothetical protein